MQAKIIGINNSEFTDKDGKPQKFCKYHLAVDTGDIEVGMEALTSSWNVLQDGTPPPYKLGDTIEVSYRKNNKIVIDGKAG